MTAGASGFVLSGDRGALDSSAIPVRTLYCTGTSLERGGLGRLELLVLHQNFAD
jgi:hypothetical protein